MATIALLIRGAIVNAAAFSGGNYLLHYLSSNGKAALAEKTQHDMALETYQAAMGTYTRERTKFLDWIKTFYCENQRSGGAELHEHGLRFQALQPGASRPADLSSQKTTNF